MKLISRSELGWPPTASAYWPTAKGVKIHYEGTPVHITDHSQCASHWTNIRNSHLANTAEGYVDVAYNFAVCLHGYVLEGRGLRHKTGANGNQTLNGDHYAVVAFLGDDGDTQPTQDMLNGLRDAIEYFQANGAGGEIKGHRDGYATSCPGDNLYSWITSGAPRPITNEGFTMDQEAREWFGQLNSMAWGTKNDLADVKILLGDIKTVLSLIEAKLPSPAPKVS